MNFSYDADGEVTSIDRFMADRLVQHGGCQERLQLRSFGRVTRPHADGRRRRPRPRPPRRRHLDLRCRQRGDELHRHEAALRPTNVSSYSYDTDGQLIGATARQRVERRPTPTTRTATPTTSTERGNRSDVRQQFGAGNTLLYDGTYNYEYDADGNLLARWVTTDHRRRNRRAATATITEYALGRSRPATSR